MRTCRSRGSVRSSSPSTGWELPSSTTISSISTSRWPSALSTASTSQSRLGSHAVMISETSVTQLILRMTHEGGQPEKDWFLAPEAARAVAARATPTFSVVIAAYNVADVISGAIESALGQTHAPHEVIVCDDGSTDDLARALEPYTDRISLIRQSNGGEGSAKNAGARAASGEFVTILDADDEYLSGRL